VSPIKIFKWLPKNKYLDDPHITESRVMLIRKKRFLNKIYQEWYELIINHLPKFDGPVVELGSGAGFLSDQLARLITSEVFFCSNVRTVMDGTSLPFASQSLRAIVMTDVFHHIPNVNKFLNEADRCLVSGGKVIMVEPWVSTWSQWIYTNLHHEPFLPHASEWEFPSSGPLSSANGALPWIVFNRDQKVFEEKFYNFNIQIVSPFMPIRYLLSGGLTWPSVAPEWSFVFWQDFEKKLAPWMAKMAMFALIVIERKNR
jgi:SAM-dependent methyltransferase